MLTHQDAVEDFDRIRLVDVIPALLQVALSTV